MHLWWEKHDLSLSNNLLAKRDVTDYHFHWLTSESKYPYIYVRNRGAVKGALQLSYHFQLNSRLSIGFLSYMWCNLPWRGLRPSEGSATNICLSLKYRRWLLIFPGGTQTRNGDENFAVGQNLSKELWGGHVSMKIFKIEILRFAKNAFETSKKIQVSRAA